MPRADDPAAVGGERGAADAPSIRDALAYFAGMNALHGPPGVPIPEWLAAVTGARAALRTEAVGSGSGGQGACPAGTGLLPAGHAPAGHEPAASDPSRNPRPKLGASVLCEHDGMLLLGRAAPPSSVAGLWQPPAGGVEFGEDVQSAAQREAKEEAGLDVEITGLAGVTQMIHRDRGKHKVIVTYHARTDGPRLTPNDEFSEMRWFTPAGVRALIEGGEATPMTAEVLAGTKWAAAQGIEVRKDRGEDSACESPVGRQTEAPDPLASPNPEQADG